MGWLVYKHTSLDTNKVYIGMTKHSIEYRWNQHCRDAVNPNKPVNHFHNALCKYGVLNWLHEVLVQDIPSIEEAESIEKRFIEEYDSYNRGYNSTLGGSGVIGTSGKEHHFYGKKKNKKSIEKGLKTKKRTREAMTDEQKYKQQENAIKGTRNYYDCKQYTFYSHERGITVTGYVGDICKQFNIHKSGLNEVAAGKREFWSGWYLKTDTNMYKRPYPRYKFMHEEYGEELLTLVNMVKKYNLSKGNLHAVIRGDRKHCKGWKVDLTSTEHYYEVKAVSR